jgi:hypothetical protein
MLQISTSRPNTLPLVYFAPETGDPEPPGGKGDPEPPGIKPPTVNQTNTSQSEVGIKPPTATAPPDAEPPDTADVDPPIIVHGGS